MILLLDTSTSLCRLTLVNGEGPVTIEWQADRELARGLLNFIVTSLEESGATLHEVRGLGVYRGPGSFTGLRIGIATMNTIATSQQVPIVGAEGNDWQTIALKRLHAGEDDRIVLPEYGRAARITQPRK